LLRSRKKALLDFVERGGGLVPLHCASYCFLNSPKYIELVGGQFKSHETGVFKETLVNTTHPVMQGLSPSKAGTRPTCTRSTTRIASSWLSGATTRARSLTPGCAKSAKAVSSTTAWGHDQRTWSNAGFLALAENGIRWASENSPAQLKPARA
jgi:type 1 glutamine amidotransferase